MSIDQNPPPPVPLDENDDGGTGSTTVDPDALAATDPEAEAESQRDIWPYIDRGIDWLFDHWPALFVGVGAFWYFWYMSNLTIEVHRGYGTSAFDIGVFDQATWLLSRFHNPFVTITGRNLFGDHTSYILLFVAPLYWLRPNPTTLLYLQAGVIALATIPIYLVGKKRIGAPLAAFMALAYLLQPALAGNNMENYHPDHFMALFVALALYAAIEDKRWLFVVSCALCLLVKEDAILIVLPMAAWFAWRRHLRLGVIVAAAAGLWTVLAFKTIRSFNHGLDLQSGTRIPFGKPGKPGTIRDVIDTMYRKPGVFVDYMRSEQRPWFAWQLLAPVAFVFLFSPEIALVGVFVLAWNLLSLFGYQHQIGYHYDFVIIPAIVIGTIWAISRMKKPKHRQIAVAVVFLCSLWTAFLWGPFAWSRNGEPGHWTASNPTVLQIEQIRKQIPKSCGVMTAYHSFVPHVDHRERIYMWPVPWRAVYWGQVDKEGQKLPFTNDIQCLFLPTTLSPDDQKLFDTFKDQFEVVATNPGATIYKRVRPE